MTDEAWGERLAGLEEVTLDGGLTLLVARSFRERRRGLAKMTPLPAGYGLRILKCNSIHTVGHALRPGPRVAGPGRARRCASITASRRGG